jgi:hypothetical protein
VIRYTALAAILTITLAFFLGLMAKVAPPPPAPVMATRQSVPSIALPTSDFRPAARYFAALHPPPPPPKPPAPPPKPIPPDIATLFRRDVGAILPGPRVLVSGNIKGQRVSRSLKVGDLYAEGWRIAALNTRSAILRKGREQRLVNFFGPSPLTGAKPAAIGNNGH